MVHKKKRQPAKQVFEGVLTRCGSFHIIDSTLSVWVIALLFNIVFLGKFSKISHLRQGS